MSIRIEATDRIKKGFVYDIKLPAGAIECYVVIDGKKAIAPIRKGRVKILHIDQKKMDIFVRCERFGIGSANHFLDDRVVKFIGQCFVHNIPLPVAIKGLI